jgi:two-component system cell cycle sensor histidine kinase/response regulator CckA
VAKILIVDDNEQNLYLLEALLTAHGHQVVRARNGAAALDAARADPPDVAVADILMPVMDGFTLCREWRRDARLGRIPFVVYTATYTDPRDERLALDLGADRFLVKPLEPDAFLDAITQALASGERSGPPADAPPEEVQLKQYNAALVRKLEDKLFELEESHRALAAGDARFQAFMDHGPALAFIKDAQGRYVYANRPWRERLAAGREWKGKTDDELFAAELAAQFRESDRACRQAAGAIERLEMGVLPEGGRPRHWMMFKFPLPEDGLIGGVMLDVTAHVLVEQRLRLVQRLEAAGRLAAGVAHDFNNLLTAISGQADLLLGGGMLDERSRQAVELISKLGEQGAALTRQLMTVGRSSGVGPEVVRPDAVIRDLEPMLRYALNRGAQVALELNAGAAGVRLVRGQLEQVVLNLAFNARDAMPGGGQFTVRTECVGDTVRLRVSDTGAGMTREVKGHLFEPFFTTKEPGKGTGLGLATVYGIVVAAGGRIEVVSDVGQGTTFTIDWPRA